MVSAKGKKIKCPRCKGYPQPRSPCPKAGKEAKNCSYCRENGFHSTNKKRAIVKPVGYIRCNKKGLLIDWCDYCSGSGYIRMKEEQKQNRKLRKWGFK